MIRNYRDLRTAYNSVILYEELKKKYPKKNTLGAKASKKYIVELKKEIRKFHKKTSDRRIIKGDYDGYLELITLPENIASKKEANMYFDVNERLVCRPSQFDCTGQAFTCWVKIFKRRGRFMAYHNVGYDV